MSERERIALCVTCLVDQVVPEVGVATVRLLRRAGFEVDFPADQTCCGQPFFNSGRHGEAADLARRTVAIFAPYDAVVLPSGSCTSMIAVEYPHLLEPWPEWHAQAKALAAKTYELTRFLVERACWSPAAAGRLEAGRVTYHDSCHMCRLLDSREPPRALLRRCGLEGAEMEESDRCCGFGGLFSLRLPEVSNAMTGEKLRQAEAAGSQVVVTADPGCLVQMRGMAAPDQRVEHVATVLDTCTTDLDPGTETSR